MGVQHWWGQAVVVSGWGGCSVFCGQAVVSGWGGCYEWVGWVLYVCGQAVLMTGWGGCST